MAPSMSQTRAIRLLQKSENSAIRTEPRVVVRVRVPSRFLLTSNYYQLQSTMIAQWARVRHVTVRILIRLFPKVAFATASLPYFPVLPNNAKHASHGTPRLQAFPLPQSEVCMTTRRCRLGRSGLRSFPPRSRWLSAQSLHVGTNWPQESLYFFQSSSMALAISLAAERNQFDFLRRRSLRMLATWRLLPK